MVTRAAPITSPIIDRARTALNLLRSQNMRQQDMFAIHPAPPTVTMGTAGAAPIISPAIRVAPTRGTNGYMDVNNDPHFEFVGVGPDGMSFSSGDMCRARVLTGGVSQSARTRPSLRCRYTGQAIEFYFRMLTTSFTYRVRVNGLYVTAALQIAAVAIGQRYYLRIDMGAVTTANIEVEFTDAEFGGAAIEQSGSISRTQTERMKIAILSDSYGGGANGVAHNDAFCSHFSRCLNCDVYNFSIGSTGFVAPGGDGNGTYINRLMSDVLSVSPDVLLITGPYNDVSYNPGSGIISAATIGAAVTATLTAAMNALPNTLIVQSGVWNPSGHANNDAAFSADLATQSACAALGVPFFSLRNPGSLVQTQPLWLTGTSYTIGNVVVVNNFAWKCAVAHTSGTFATDLASNNWICCALNTGTGRVGTTTGIGNGDTWISSDGIHPSLIGHQGVGAYMAQNILAQAKIVAGMA